jgi:hypothetical protein
MNNLIPQRQQKSTPLTRFLLMTKNKGICGLSCARPLYIGRAEYRRKRRIASDGVPIEHFIWTLHAERRRKQRLLDPVAVERAIRAGHRSPRINRGQAEWMAHGLTIDGRRFVVVYDHPHYGDPQTARIVSVWEL